MLLFHRIIIAVRNTEVKISVELVNCTLFPSYLSSVIKNKKKFLTTTTNVFSFSFEKKEKCHKSFFRKLDLFMNSYSSRVLLGLCC